MTVLAGRVSQVTSVYMLTGDSVSPRSTFPAMPHSSELLSMQPAFLLLRTLLFTWFCTTTLKEAASQAHNTCLNKTQSLAPFIKTNKNILTSRTWLRTTATNTKVNGTWSQPDSGSDTITSSQTAALNKNTANETTSLHTDYRTQ